MRIRVFGVLLATMAIGLLALASSASADTTGTSSCRASAIRLKVLTADPAEGVVAGAAAPTPCATQGAGQVGSTIAIPPPAPPNTLSVTMQNVYAITQAVKQNPETVSDMPAALAGATNAQIKLLGLNITADAIDSQASATCVNGQPAFTGSSKVVDLKLNGNDISLDQLIDAISHAIDGSPLAGLVTLTVNQQVKTANSLSQTALHLSIHVGSTNILDLTIGESIVSTTGNPCALPAPPVTCGNGTVLDPNTGMCVPNPNCPSGTTFDPNANACVQNPPNCPSGTTFSPQANACVANPPNCPTGTSFDPNANACVPNASSCPSGSTFDPNTHVCVTGPAPCPSGSQFVQQYNVCVVTVTVTKTTTEQAGSGNGHIGSANGPLAHCGHLETVLFQNNRKSSFTQRYRNHDRVVIRGRLISCGSHPQPIIGARIDVVHVINGVRHLVKTGVKTRAHGRFTLIEPRNIRTRTIEFNYRGDLNKAAIVSSRTLRYTLVNSKGQVLRTH